MNFQIPDRAIIWYFCLIMKYTWFCGRRTIDVQRHYWRRTALRYE